MSETLSANHRNFLEQNRQIAIHPKNDQTRHLCCSSTYLRNWEYFNCFPANPICLGKMKYVTVDTFISILTDIKNDIGH